MRNVVVVHLPQSDLQDKILDEITWYLILFLISKNQLLTLSRCVAMILWVDWISRCHFLLRLCVFDGDSTPECSWRCMTGERSCSQLDASHLFPLAASVVSSRSFCFVSYALRRTLPKAAPGAEKIHQQVFWLLWRAPKQTCSTSGTCSHTVSGSSQISGFPGQLLVRLHLDPCALFAGSPLFTLYLVSLLCLEERAVKGELC